MSLGISHRGRTTAAAREAEEEERTEVGIRDGEAGFPPSNLSPDRQRAVDIHYDADVAENGRRRRK